MPILIPIYRIPALVLIAALSGVAANVAYARAAVADSLERTAGSAYTLGDTSAASAAAARRRTPTTFPIISIAAAFGPVNISGQ